MEEEEETGNGISSLEQRLESVESFLASSLSPSPREEDEKSSSSISSSSSNAILFAKLASLRSALVDSRRASTSSSSPLKRANSGEDVKEQRTNDIKRLHDRLESVLFQIAVVGNARRRSEEQKCHYFGRSARAIARDCLVLTFSFGNRLVPVALKSRFYVTFGER